MATNTTTARAGALRLAQEIRGRMGHHARQTITDQAISDVIAAEVEPLLMALDSLMKAHYDLYMEIEQQYGRDDVRRHRIVRDAARAALAKWRGDV